MYGCANSLLREDETGSSNLSDEMRGVSVLRYDIEPQHQFTSCCLVPLLQFKLIHSRKICDIDACHTHYLLCIGTLSTIDNTLYLGSVVVVVACISIL